MTDLKVPSSITNEELIKFVTEIAQLCKPNVVVWCD